MIFMDKDKPPHTEPSAKPAVPEKKHEKPQTQVGESPSEQKPGAPSEMTQAEIEQAFSELTERLLRLTAEFDNYKKRTAKEKEALAAQSEGRMMVRFLPIYEEIGFAEQGVAKIADKHVRDGALLVLGKLRKGFESEGLQPMKLEGEKYDPFRHEVALREESDAPEGTIVRVIKQGYLYKGAVLQHAIVSVSSGKKKDEKEAEKPGEKQEAIKGNKEVGE